MRLRLERPLQSAYRRGEARMDNHTIRTGQISASIKADGAELRSLKNAEGVELLWQAGPEWPRHAPLLFPIVGEVGGEQIRVRGKVYKMLRHGVARDND